ncbi:PREDICTED: fasciclin-like arabinogalactan protein 12 [Fragaria vesca subsp. vesca]|uniref:fasciclin-like arabinogalactan protein 12 n=1 Tax=Fragaria vesca subsp. vesca TaxID=101020 RepID=UPI0002C328C8|nr:PREDICTED: fasciclin-like arabinogalactan protein 12 [Fragaria vesca subsp. vesca]
MKQQLQPLLSLPLLLILLSHCTGISAQGAPAASPDAGPIADAPAPPGPTNVTKILEKSGNFNLLIRLLKTTQVDTQLYSQLNDSYSKLTILAPTDAAFSKLKSGSLNSLSESQKDQLLQFHLIPDFLTISNFQTLSNPVRTQAGDQFEYPLNITTSGNSVNITTGLVNTSISGTVYTDNQLAVYQVDSVLQPYGIFAPKPLPPAPAPAPEKAKHKKKASDDSPVAAVKSAAGSVVCDLSRNGLVSIGVAVVFAAAMFLLQ